MIKTQSAKFVASIIYVNYKVDDFVVESIKSLYKNDTTINFEVIVVDNSSSKDLRLKLPSIKKSIIYIDSKSNLGFGKACNLGAKKAKGDYLIFINPDTKLTKNSIKIMLDYATKHPNMGALGPMIVDSKHNPIPSISAFFTRLSNLVFHSPVNTLWPNNPVTKSFLLSDLDKSKTQTVDVVGGACMLIPSKVFSKVKGFDENFFMYFEEHDICFRIRKLGLDVVYFPNTKVMHFVGQSLRNTILIKRNFESSRFKYSKKYFGLGYATLSELFLRYVNADSIIIFLLVLVSFYINTYRIGGLMLFFGDIARDYIAARDMILGTSFSLVGIQSSVTWLHQGPIAIWLIALALKVSAFNPVAPAILFGFINALTTGLVFYLGRKYFSRTVGFVSSILYLSSPMVVVNARMPYHTSLVPFFAVLFIIFFMIAVKDKKFIPSAMFLLGLMMLVELSNIVVSLVAIIIFFVYKINIKPGLMLKSTLAFLLGISPFIIYDILHGPTYLKFPIWIVYRLIKPFLGYSTISQAELSLPFPSFYHQTSAIVFPQLPILAMVMLFVSVYILFKRFRSSKNYAYAVILLWVLIPYTAFFLHRTPGPAYFTLLYPAVLISVAITINSILNTRLAIIVASAIAFTNIMLLTTNDFFVSVNGNIRKMPPLSYEHGYSWIYSNQTAIEMIKESDNKEFTFALTGEIGKYKSNYDPYRYFTWLNGGIINKNSSTRYEIYNTRDNNANIDFIYVNDQDSLLKK